MANKMLIDATHPEETRVVVVRGNRVEEFDFEIRQPPSAARQHLSRQSHPRRTVAAGGIHRLRRQSPRLPRVQRNPSGLLPDPGRRPAGADRRGRAGASRCGRRARSSSRSARAAASTRAAPLRLEQGRRTGAGRGGPEANPELAPSELRSPRASEEPSIRPRAEPRRRMRSGKSRWLTRRPPRDGMLMHPGDRPMPPLSAPTEDGMSSPGRRRSRRPRSPSVSEPRGRGFIAGADAATTGPGDIAPTPRNRDARARGAGSRRVRRGGRETIESVRRRRCDGGGSRAHAADAPAVQDPGGDQAPADHAGAGRQGGARHQGRGADHLPVARRPLFGADAEHRAGRRHLAARSPTRRTASG